MEARPREGLREPRSRVARARESREGETETQAREGCREGEPECRDEGEREGHWVRIQEVERESE